MRLAAALLAALFALPAAAVERDDAMALRWKRANGCVGPDKIADHSTPLCALKRPGAARNVADDPRNLNCQTRADALWKDRHIEVPLCRRLRSLEAENAALKARLATGSKP